MAPSNSVHVVIPPPPSSTYLTPTTDNRAIPPKKTQFHYQHVSKYSSNLPNGLPYRPTRLLTVDEALQFSPLSSIVPFSPDIVPIPNAHITSPQPILSEAEHTAARRQLDQLDRSLAQNHRYSEQTQLSLKKLQSLLEPSTVTTFKFKQPTGFERDPSKVLTPLDNNRHLKPSTQLGPFAKMIFQGSSLPDRYPTPVSPESPSQKHPLQSQLSQKLQPGLETERFGQDETLNTTSAGPQRYSSNFTAFSQNAQHYSKSDILPANQAQKSYPVVLITPPPSETRQSGYVDVTLPDDEYGIKSQAILSRKRKCASEHDDNESATKLHDQRAISDEELRQLQNLIQDIFEADDELPPNNAGTDAGKSSQFFIASICESQGLNSLAPAIQVKLESLLQKVISHGRYAEIPAESLSRLQTLCEGALSIAETSEFDVHDMSDQDDDCKWVHGIEELNLGLRSARTILRIMTGGREEKDLYPEELIQNIVRVVEKALKSCITPIVESRSSGQDSAIFAVAFRHRKLVSQLFYDVNKAMGLLEDILGRFEIAETILSTLEFLTTPLLFVENAHNEKESVLGIQKFESLRRSAMDIIAEIFSHFPDQRRDLFNGILTSLQKLPVNKLHARQYKLTEGKSIQLVSALILRLIQISATSNSNTKHRKDVIPSADDQKESSVSDSEVEEGRPRIYDQYSSDESSASEKPSQHHMAVRQLAKTANFLSDSAARNAQYVVGFYVDRAMNAPKTGDQPHRQLLDMFAEDLIVVLGLPEWPAAELLLRALLIKMVVIAEKAKSNAPAKGMALELLGQMGSAISDLVTHTRQLAKTLDNHDSSFSSYLMQLLDDYMDAKLENTELLGLQGPYHAVFDYLHQQRFGDKLIASAHGYFLTQWAKTISTGNLMVRGKTESLAKKLLTAISRVDQMLPDCEMEAISNNQVRLSYVLTVLNMDFCRQFDRILKILLDSISSEQITVRTRSLKSVTQMLEQDPSLLDRAGNVKGLIRKCATDVSSMVRDSALMLIGKCILLKPALEQEFCHQILDLTYDPAIAVRKRALRLLKDIYLRNAKIEVKAAIADSLIHRIKDADTGVSDLARQILEELWFLPFYKLAEISESSTQDKVLFQLQISLLVKSIQRSEGMIPGMILLLQDVLSNASKSAANNFQVCKVLVARAFDAIIDSEDFPERLEQNRILQLLTVFARANSKLFVSEQLQLLQPYISNLSTSDDLNVFRSVIITFRSVLPTLSTIKHSLLREVQGSLLQSVAKLGWAEMDEVAACLWTISQTLEEEPEKLIKLVVSVIKNLNNLKGIDFADPKSNQELARLKKYIRIAGYFGKHCDFESHLRSFRQALSWWKGTSVSGLIVDSISPFTLVKQPFSLRADALDGIGLICQSWPFQFNRDSVSHTFQDILENGSADLQKIVLSSFRDFFHNQERQAEAKSTKTGNSDGENPTNKLGGSMTASDSDGASALIAQRFLQSILRIAMATQELSAVTATQVIVSINRQGLVHPKESGPALVALETSTNRDIADIAFKEHRALHQQHESMFEREYMKAVHEAFRYQKETVRDPSGVTVKPVAPKLRATFEIIKTSKGKYQKKFLSNLCSKIDFDIAKLDTPEVISHNLHYSRFLIENLAFFDYARLDELLHTISCMEKIVASTGSGIAHNISTEVFHVELLHVLENQVEGDQERKEVSNSSKNQVNPARLFQLTTAAVILSCLWDARTYLRRLFGLDAGQQRRDNKAKPSAKDLNKAPTKSLGFSGEKFLTAIDEKVKTLNSNETMLEECRAFVHLLSIDSEVKVPKDDDEANRPETPLQDDDDDCHLLPVSGTSKSRKRSASVSVVGTPHRKKRARPQLGKRRKSGKSVEDEDEEDWD